MFSFEFSEKNPQASVAFASFGSMHTVMEMVLVADDREEAEKTARAIYERVSELNGKFDRFDEKSAVALINAGEQAQVEDGDLYMALQLCEAFRVNTAGYFDICAEAGRGAPEALPRYTLDAKGRTIRFSRSGTRLDLGGFAKGFALDQARVIIEGAGIGNALVNFGDSSVLAMGSHPCGDHWPVGVVDSSHTFAMRDGALSVSGRTRRGAAHIVDPLSGEMRGGGRRIVVKGRSALIAEILSTALYAAPAERRAGIMATFEGYAAYEITPNEG